MSGGSEQQTPAPRYKVTVFIGVGEEMVPFGRTRDLSRSGMFLETEERPPLDSVQEFSIVWGDDTLVCPSRVVRHADDGIGITFIDPGPGFMSALDEIIEGMGGAPLPKY